MMSTSRSSTSRRMPHKGEQEEERRENEHVGTAVDTEGRNMKCDIRHPREIGRRLNGLRERLARRGAAAILGDSAVGQVVSTGTVNFLNIYNTVLVVRLVCTWFPNAPPSLVQPLRYGERVVTRQTRHDRQRDKRESDRRRGLLIYTHTQRHTHVWHRELRMADMRL